MTFEGLPIRLRNALVGLIRAMRGPGLTDADRLAMFEGLKNNFCSKCGAAKPDAECSCKIGRRP